MCGRFILTSPGKVIRDFFGLSEIPQLEPRYNIAPTTPVAVVRLLPGDDHRQLDLLRWGLIPYWAEDESVGARTINARGETAAERPAFRDAFQRRRCLVPADGFFEWAPTNGRKQPHLIRLVSQGPFAMAGLWERWKSPVGEWVESCTIVTTDANDLVRPLHDRMPVVLPPSAHDVWLDPHLRDRNRLESLLKPYPASEMTAYPVSTRVSNVANDDPECIAPLEGHKKGQIRLDF